MGQLLFIIYITAMLTLRLLGRIIIYADDTALYYDFDTAEELVNAMQKDASVLHKWLYRNVLTMNTSVI